MKGDETKGARYLYGIDEHFHKILVAKMNGRGYLGVDTDAHATVW